MLKALAGREPTPDSQVLMRALEGAKASPRGEEIGRAVGGIEPSQPRRPVEGHVRICLQRSRRQTN